MSDVDNPAVKEPPYHELYTERLKLRTLRVSDAERLMPILGREEVMQWTTEPAVETIAQAERWIKDRALGQDVFNFIIELRRDSDQADKPPIVGVGGTFHVPKIGYLIHPDYWGKGFASEALSALVPAIFERFPSTLQVKEDEGSDATGLDYVEGWIDVENAASRRVLEKCGFMFCEETIAPGDAPGNANRVAVFRRARDGMDLGGMGLVDGSAEETRPTPPVQ